MAVKLLKDPIYGYIGIEQNILHNIIDTSCFQRLRNIRQTSYEPLYPASHHNRFIHSIGVYYLGGLAAETLRDSEALSFFSQEEREVLFDTFRLSCLLHDVGHAPFSHSGEDFFLNHTNGQRVLYQQLYDAVNDDVFCQDADAAKPAAAHEIMSVIVAIEEFGTYIRDKDFFSRCITGYEYRDASSEAAQIRNCLISLLNSSLIDVDRLDYIIRDAATTGYQSVSIDYHRLLKGLSIVEYEGKKRLAYKKSSLSIIENAIYAHDSERKWIQNHPVILYEIFLIKHIIESTEKEFSRHGKKLFSKEALSSEGFSYGDAKYIRLLSDDDIIYYAKNKPKSSDGLTDEYFSRAARRRPFWKTEAEYRSLFERDMGPDLISKMEDVFRELERFLQSKGFRVLNQNVIDYCEEELATLSTVKALPEREIENLRDGPNKILRWARCFRDFATEQGIDFNFVIINANMFQSSFSKSDVDQLLVNFTTAGSDEQPLVKKITQVSPLPERNNGERERYFYVYYRMKNEKISPSKMAIHLHRALIT